MTQGVSSRGESTPIAWGVPGGDVVLPGRDGFDAKFARVSAHPDAVGRYWMHVLPGDAVELVPVTELDEARIERDNMRTERDNAWREVAEARDGRSDAWLQLVAEWLLAEALYGNQAYTSDLDGAHDRVVAERNEAQEAAAWAGEMLDSARERNTELRAEVEWLQASPASPPLDSPEALRMAAKVAEARGLFESAEAMNGMAHRQEKARAAVAAEAERDARIHATTTALSDFEEHNQTEMSLVQIAVALDDLGYRLDPTHTKDGAR